MSDFWAGIWFVIGFSLVLLISSYILYLMYKSFIKNEEEWIRNLVDGLEIEVRNNGAHELKLSGRREEELITLSSKVLREIRTRPSIEGYLSQAGKETIIRVTKQWKQ